jgi:hypothetical protein
MDDSHWCAGHGQTANTAKTTKEVLDFWLVTYRLDIHGRFVGLHPRSNGLDALDVA